MTLLKQEIKPSTFERLGNNTYYYNYNIKETTIYNPDGDEIQGWEFIQVCISGIPNYNKCVAAIIREYVSLEKELELINNFNMYNSKLSNNIKDKDDYINFLTLLQTIKVNVSRDFNK